MSILRPLARLGRPSHLLFAALTYLLGAGIARYLGALTVRHVFWLGLIGVLMAQMGMSLLGVVFRPADEPLSDSDDPVRRRSLRDAALYLSAGALAAAGVIGFILYKDGRLAVPALMCLGLSLASILLYAVPPVRLMDRGFGELLVATHISYLVPSIGFLLQARSYHLLLNASVLPLTLLLLATFLALDFPSYVDDLRYGRNTLLISVGWRIAVLLHQALLVAAYFALASAGFLGFSIKLLWPGFLTIPFAILQFNLMRNLALGAKPYWALLTANALAIFCLTAYFLALSFWLR
jgi:1,4-dihydroxy-2-naphthoate octaprenyltransferase